MKLLNLLKQFDEVEVDETTGEILNADILNSISETIAGEVDNFGEYLAFKEAEILALETLSKSYIERAAAIQNKLSYLKKFISKAVETFGEEEKNGRWLRGKLIGIKDTSKFKVSITNPEVIPDNFRTTTAIFRKEQFAKLPEKIKKAVLKESEKIDESFIKESVSELIDNPAVEDLGIPGVSKSFVRSIQVYGLKKIKGGN